MDFATDLPFSVNPQKPVFIKEATQLAHKLAKLTQPKLAKLMSVSPDIATAVHNYYQTWDESATGRPALWTYVGDVYKGVKAHSLSQADANWAEQRLVISSGLYGLVRPFDGIQAYRLEMKSAFPIGRAKNINQFWGTKLAQFIDRQNSDWLCNLSSSEYSAVVTKHISLSVITPVFFDTKPNRVIGQVPIYSKMMRGVMARWMIDNRVSEPEQLKKFTNQNYSYDASRSKPGFPAFRREIMLPLRFD